MTEKTLIIHGYSDCSESFVGIRNFLCSNNIPAETIYYADYESREDSLTFNDVIDGLNDELIRLGFIDTNGKKKCDLNVIVHSTGGLVIRHWISRFYKDAVADCPIRRLVMLAPANFGSPLAVRGKSFLGELFKGRWKIGDFLEVGRQILDGLELASPFQWNLAHRDLFVQQPFYTSNGIQLTILCGAEDYDGLRGWINKPGTDGTVVIAGTSLNSIKLRLSFIRPADPEVEHVPFKWNTTASVNEIAFGVLPGLNHGTIVDKAGEAGAQAATLLLRALQSKSSNDFLSLKKDLEGITAQTYADPARASYQQFILLTTDHQGDAIPDYSIEFFVFRSSRTTDHTVAHDDWAEELEGPELEWSNKVQRVITKEFATSTVNSAYRRFLVNPAEVLQIAEDARKAMGEDIVLCMKVYVNDIDKKIGYNNNEIEKIVLYHTGKKDPGAPSFFFPNTTTLIELCIDRFNKYVSVGTEPRKH